MIPRRLATMAWLMALLGLLAGCSRQQGKVVDQLTGNPIAGATIYHNGRMTVSRSDGSFVLKGVHREAPVLIKAPGYRRANLTLENSDPLRVPLESFEAKGVYLSYYGVRAPAVRDRVLQLIDTTAINAVVIDVKPDEGALSFQWSIPLAEKIGSMARPTIDDPEALISELHAKGIYVIGRISVFKDNLLATKRPDWAIRNAKTQAPYAERDKMAWMDPFSTEVWDYNIAVARAAAEAGFDEVQFDYVRFPVNTGPSVATYRKDYNAANREAAIVGFLQKAYQELLPYNVHVAADVFGITCWYDEENGIGQPLRKMAPWADYLCPMIYPSGFTSGLLGTKETPVSIPREVILWSLQQALPMVGDQGKKLRPWLQNFKDYAFDRRQFTEKEIALQILACEEVNTSGWLLWDAASKYSYTAEALKAMESGTISNLLVETSKVEGVVE